MMTKDDGTKAKAWRFVHDAAVGLCNVRALDAMESVLQCKRLRIQRVEVDDAGKFVKVLWSLSHERTDDVIAEFACRCMEYIAERAKLTDERILGLIKATRSWLKRKDSALWNWNKAIDTAREVKTDSLPIEVSVAITIVRRAADWIVNRCTTRNSTYASVWACAKNTGGSVASVFTDPDRKSRERIKDEVLDDLNVILEELLNEAYQVSLDGT